MKSTIVDSARGAQRLPDLRIFPRKGGESLHSTITGWHHQVHSLNMYHSPVRRRSSASDDRMRRDSRASVSTQQLPPYNHANANSPTQCSPTNGTHPHSPYAHNSTSRPSSATITMPSGVSPRFGPPPSPKFNGHPQRSPGYAYRENGGSYYDPTSEHREGQGWSNAQYPKSPVQVRYQSRECMNLYLLLYSMAMNQLPFLATNPILRNLPLCTARPRPKAFHNTPLILPLHMHIHPAGTVP